MEKYFPHYFTLQSILDLIHATFFHATSLAFFRDVYCDLVNTLNEKCLEVSILEIWKFSRRRIEKLTQQDIINAVNLYRER